MTFKIYKSVGEWRFRIVAKNGWIIAQGEGYKRKADCVKTVMRIQDEARTASVQFMEKE